VRTWCIWSECCDAVAWEWIVSVRGRCCDCLFGVQVTRLKSEEFDHFGPAGLIALLWMAFHVYIVAVQMHWVLERRSIIRSIPFCECRSRCCNKFLMLSCAFILHKVNVIFAPLT